MKTSDEMWMKSREEAFTEHVSWMQQSIKKESKRQILERYVNNGISYIHACMRGTHETLTIDHLGSKKCNPEQAWLYLLPSLLIIFT